MKKASLSILLIVTLGLLTLSACGGGGGGGSAPQGPTSAILTLSTATTITFPAATTINSYDVTISLPSGVTVQTMPSSSITGTDVLITSGTASGAGAIIYGTYTAATGTFPGKVKVFVDSAAGFAAGEFCKVHANIASGSPTASSFTPLTLVEATGIDTNTSDTVLGLEGSLILSATAVIQ